jgi:hypothetical protein
MTRAMRRYLLERKKRRVRSYYGGYWREYPDWRAKAIIGKLAQTPTPCSCWACNTNYWPNGTPVSVRRRLRALEDV